MSRLIFRLLAVTLALSSATARAQQAFYISCEGAQSTGGGVLLYQYELLNMTGAPLMLTDLRIGTDDLLLADYTNITNPAGFAFSVGAGDTQLGTTTVKTPHGAFVPNLQWVRPTAGMIHWSNPQGLLLPPQGTAVFGFNNQLQSEDVEWVANALGGGIGIGTPAIVVAGPMGIFTTGPVHAPVPEPVSGMIVFASLAAMMRRR
jgi:hypothetical protein